MEKAEWIEARLGELLPVDYYHVTFTLPSKLAPLALANQRVVYNLLFKSVAQSLLTIAADPKHLGAEIGFFGVLHTWGQKLQLHPHVHTVVPAGGLSADGERWVACRPGFFLPVRVLSRLFRRLFLQGLKKSYKQGKLEFHGRVEGLADEETFANLLESCREKEWTVHAKAPTAGPERVLKYLSHYTHKVAISNHRLVKLEQGKVTFEYKDYRDEEKRKEMVLEADEFIGRFLMHVLPDGFMRIRYYGFMSNGRRSEKLAQCRHLLGVTESKEPEAPSRQSSELALQRVCGQEVEKGFLLSQRGGCFQFD